MTFLTLTLLTSIETLRRIGHIHESRSEAATRGYRGLGLGTIERFPIVVLLRAEWEPAQHKSDRVPTKRPLHLIKVCSKWCNAQAKRVRRTKWHSDDLNFPAEQNPRPSAPG